MTEEQKNEPVAPSLEEDTQKSTSVFLPQKPPEPKAVSQEEIEVPEYLTSVYTGRYFRKSMTSLFDDEWMSALSSFFMGKKLVKSVLDEIREGVDVLQLGLASGTFESSVATKMNSKGVYDIEDVSKIHIESARPRLAAWLNAKMIERDFTVSNDKKYDVVICYFALHEMPDTRKKATIARSLGALKANGKVVFVDYSQPKKYHPFKWLVKKINRLSEPFAESLWYNEIEDFAPKTDNFIWAKKTFFGQMYQCVIAQKK